MNHPTDRIAHPTAFVTPVVEHWMERELFYYVIIVETLLSLLPASNILFIFRVD